MSIGDPIFCQVRSGVCAWGRDTFVRARNAAKAWGYLEDQHELLLSASRQVEEVAQRMEEYFAKSINGRSFSRGEWAAAVHDFGRRFTAEILREAYSIATRQEEQTP